MIATTVIAATEPTVIPKMKGIMLCSLLVRNEPVDQVFVYPSCD